MPARSADPHRPALVAAAVLLGAALHANNGFYSPWALGLVVSALACAWSALVIPHALGALVPDRDDLVRALLAAAVLAQLAVILRSPIGMYFARPMPEQHPGFAPGLGVAAVSALAAFTDHRALRRGAAIGLLGATALLGALTYRGSPSPAIDVVTVHDEAFAAMARGDSPYSMTFPDLYNGREAFYPPGTVVDGRVQFGFPYPPLSLLMAWPGYLLGDFRWTELAAWTLAAGAAIAAAGATGVAVLAAALWLFTPRAFFALEQAWTDPLALVWLAAALLAATRGRRTQAAVFIGLAAATKQYLVLAIPLVHLLDPRTEARRFRTTIIALAAGAAATVPAALADPYGFYTSVVALQLREALRVDALSLAVPFAQAAGAPMSAVAYAGIVGAATLTAARMAPRGLAGFTAALAVTLLTTFAFGKKAFCNYYIFVLAVLAMAVATSRAAPIEGGGDADAVSRA